MNPVTSTRLSHIVGMAMACLALTACGPDLVGAAATGASTKKAELEEGQKTQEKVKDQLQQAMDQAQKREEQ